MTPYVLAIVITVGTVLVESLSAGAHPMQKLRALHQPRWSPPPSVWVLIGLLWYAICFIALVRLFRIEPPPLEVVGLLIALMLANAFANVPQFRLQRLDAAFFYLFPYWVLLGIFLGRVRTVDVTVAALFGLYAVYQVYAGFWAWRLWRLNTYPPAERTALRFVPILTLVGIAGLLVTLLLGFEEPHTLLLVVSSFLVVSAPAAIFGHVLFTRHLDSNEKRELIGYFLSRHAAVAIDEYVSSTDRRAGLARLRQMTRQQEE